MCFLEFCIVVDAGPSLGVGPARTPSCGLYFHSERGFQRAEVFSFDKVQFTNLFLWVVFLVLCLDYLCLTQGHKDSPSPPNIVFQKLRVLGLMFRSGICLELLSVYGVRHGSKSMLFACGCPLVPHLSKGCPFPIQLPL